MELVRGVSRCARDIELLTLDINDIEEIKICAEEEGKTEEEIKADIQLEIDHYIRKKKEYKSKIQAIADDYERTQQQRDKLLETLDKIHMKTVDCRLMDAMDNEYINSIHDISEIILKDVSK
jgi:hypothetical protein